MAKHVLRWTENFLQLGSNVWQMEAKYSSVGKCSAFGRKTLQLVAIFSNEPEVDVHTQKSMRTDLKTIFQKQ